MIEITADARRHLVDHLPDETDDTCFRVVPAQGGNYSLRIATAEKEDVTVKHEGNVILALDPGVARRLDGWLLDVETRPGGDRGLILMPLPTGTDGD
jgi:hypothetical protein